MWREYNIIVHSSQFALESLITETSNKINSQLDLTFLISLLWLF